MKRIVVRTIVLVSLTGLLSHVATALAGDLPAGAAAAPTEHRVLWYAKPASVWSKEALPIGNGRLGAMLFGGVTVERIQFNESSLWSGDNNWDGEYQTGDRGFGSYRNFGDLFVEFGKVGRGGRDLAQRPRAGRRQRRSATRVDGRRTPSGASPSRATRSSGRPSCRRPRRSLPTPSPAPTTCPPAIRRSGCWPGPTTARPGPNSTAATLDKPFESRHQTKQFTVEKPAAVPVLSLLVRAQERRPFPGGRDRAGGCRVRHRRARLGTAADYRRELDISTGVHRTTFSQDGVTFTREAFASRPDQVLVFHYTAKKDGQPAPALSGRVRLKPGQPEVQLAADADGLSWDAVMPNELKHACRVRVLHTGGSVKASGDALVFAGCDSLTLLLAARTDYAPSFEANWRGEPPAPVVAKEIAAAEAKSFEALRQAHLGDLAPLLARVRVDWGRSDAATLALPTDERLAAYAKGAADPDLEQTMFQYGRYLLASCSRPAGCRRICRGCGTTATSRAWASDYHSNINVQMNYWGAEATALAECHEPLLDFVTACAEPCRIATRKAFGENVRGWTARTSQSIFGGNGWQWNIPASAWYAQHMAWHYAFTQDQEFLRQQGYPMVKEICQFWEDHLKQLPDGTLVAPNGWSPEHGPREDGVMHDQQIIWDLFQSYLEMAQALGVDADYQKKVADMQARLAPNKIGKWGQLQEWQADRDDPKDTHRHISHLFAVYPGPADQHDPARPSWRGGHQEPEGPQQRPRGDDGPAVHGRDDHRRQPPLVDLAVAVRRLGPAGRSRAGRASWSAACSPTTRCRTCSATIRRSRWTATSASPGRLPRCCCRATPAKSRCCPPCPRSGPREGSFAGLRARGGYRVDCAWKDGQVTAFRIVADKARDKTAKVKVRVNGELREIAPER